jgi:glycosyltransferase involved in cell wall biosynthesis
MKLHRVLVGAVGSNAHIQNMARALYEADALYAYATGGADVFHGPVLRTVRRWAGATIPGLDGALGRRRITGIPESHVVARWRWELPRVVASRLGWDERLVDWLWERSELDFDRACARLVNRAEVGGFLGVEYGALDALNSAKRLGKPAIVAFLSPHHRTLAAWVATQYERFPELASREQSHFEARATARNERRDQEAELADLIVTNSTFTATSFVDAGFSAHKIIAVPLGGPNPISSSALPDHRPAVTRFLYAGPVSVRKGAHYLLRAWRRIARPGIELHFYGAMLLPERLKREAEGGPGGATVTFHGSVPVEHLKRAYLESSALVLPTLCDGFGMVVSEALAHGLPVITTNNAGAADAVTHGRTGLVVPAADEEALAEALAWCADHPGELFEMRRPALESAARWTWADYRRTFSNQLAGAVAHQVDPSGEVERGPMSVAG